MIRSGISAFASRRVLLLQGPVGPFFSRLANALEEAGAYVGKVNFNGGDWLFFPTRAKSFTGTATDWTRWLEDLLRKEQFDLVLLFGDCRPLHVTAKKVATKLGIEIGVFEEGYLRPNFVTLERQGVNGFSCLPRSIAPFMAAPIPQPGPVRQVHPTFWPMAIQAFAYGVAHWLTRPLFPNYVHHRPMGIGEACRWVRAAWRKPLYQWRERGVFDSLCGDESSRFFLVPLQVFNDSQVTIHAPFSDLRSFIRRVMESFARHAPHDTRLVFKHHPLDRGHTDYTRFIRKLARILAISHRTLYIHDQNLPKLLQRAEGVVVINSTVGLSALHHGTPTIACGTAIYDLPGLTYQGPLDAFWTSAAHSPPDPTSMRRFRSQLIARTQLNGSFYRALPDEEARAGLIWPAQSAPPEKLTESATTRATRHSAGRTNEGIR